MNIQVRVWVVFVEDTESKEQLRITLPVNDAVGFVCHDSCHQELILINAHELPSVHTPELWCRLEHFSVHSVRNIVSLNADRSQLSLTMW